MSERAGTEFGKPFHDLTSVTVTGFNIPFWPADRTETSYAHALVDGCARACEPDKVASAAALSFFLQSIGDLSIRLIVNTSVRYFSANEQWSGSSALLQLYFLTNRQYFSITTEQHKH